MPLDDVMRGCLTPISLFTCLLLSACGPSPQSTAVTAVTPAVNAADAAAINTAAIPAPEASQVEEDPLTTELREPKLLTELPGSTPESQSPSLPSSSPRDSSIIIKGDQSGAIANPP